jgi:hypothetical protein
MATPSMKEELILNHEAKMARLLALRIIDKPAPPFWASFIPMVFVFYAHKLKEYSLGLDNFVDNYLLPRRDAMKAVSTAKNARCCIPLERLLERASDMPPPAKALYLKWITRLAEHYMLLLSSDGECHEELVRAGYRNKSNYLSTCETLGTTECQFNLALLPGIEGDAEGILLVVQRMNAGIVALHQHNADLIFP